MVSRGAATAGAALVVVAVAGVAGMLLLAKKLSVSVSPSSVGPADTVLMTVTNATPNGALTLTIQTEPTAQYGVETISMPAADANGNSAIYVALNNVLSAGTQLVRVTDEATGKTATTTFVVT